MDFLVLLGPPGSGKGTLSRMMQAEEGWRPISTGEEIRKRMADPDSMIGLKSTPYMERGDYIPDSLASELFEHMMMHQPRKAKIVLDGYPRSIPQAERFQAWVEKRKHDFRRCVFLQLDTEIALTRMRNRRVCPACRTSYPKRAGSETGTVCECCGVTLIQREDDDPERMARRVRRHDEMTAPLRDWYGQRGQLLELDASRPPRDLLLEICNV